MGLDRDRVIADIAEVLFAEPTELTDDTELIDLGLDSLRLATLVQRWRDSGCAVRFAELAEQPTLGAWLAHLT